MNTENESKHGLLEAIEGLLREEKRPMQVKEITDLLLKRNRIGIKGLEEISEKLLLISSESSLNNNLKGI